MSGLSSQNQGEKAWSENMTLSHDGRTTGIARLWARNQVEDWMDDLMLGGNRDILKENIIELALQHDLVTEFTALVAVDKTPDLTRQAQAKAAQRAAQLRATQSLAYPQTALGWKGQMLLGMLLMLAALFLRQWPSVQRAETQKAA